MKESQKKFNWKKLAIVFVVIIFVVGISIIAWVESYWGYIDKIVFENVEPWTTERIEIAIKEDYSEKFYAREFTIEDFDYKNFESIEYWDNAAGTGNNILYLYLKHPGKRQCQRAILHLRNLDFVKYADYVAAGYLA